MIVPIFAEQAAAWLAGLATRKRKPVSPATLATYRQHIARLLLSLANWYGVKVRRNVTLLHRSKTTIRQPQVFAHHRVRIPRSRTIPLTFLMQLRNLGAVCLIAFFLMHLHKLIKS